MAAMRRGRPRTGGTASFSLRRAFGRAGGDLVRDVPLRAGQGLRVVRGVRRVHPLLGLAPSPRPVRAASGRLGRADSRGPRRPSPRQTAEPVAAVGKAVFSASSRVLAAAIPAPASGGRPRPAAQRASRHLEVACRGGGDHLRILVKKSYGLKAASCSSAFCGSGFWLPISLHVSTARSTPRVVGRARRSSDLLFEQGHPLRRSASSFCGGSPRSFCTRVFDLPGHFGRGWPGGWTETENAPFAS